MHHPPSSGPSFLIGIPQFDSFTSYDKCKADLGGSGKFGGYGTISARITGRTLLDQYRAIYHSLYILPEKGMSLSLTGSSPRAKFGELGVDGRPTLLHGVGKFAPCGSGEVLHILLALGNPMVCRFGPGIVDTDAA